MFNSQINLINSEFKSKGVIEILNASFRYNERLLKTLFFLF